MTWVSKWWQFTHSHSLPLKLNAVIKDKQQPCFNRWCITVSPRCSGPDSINMCKTNAEVNVVAVLIHQLLARAYQHSIQSRVEWSILLAASSQASVTWFPCRVSCETGVSCVAWLLSYLESCTGSFCTERYWSGMLTVLDCLFGEWRCRSVGGQFKERCSFNPRGFIPLVNKD